MTPQRHVRSHYNSEISMAHHFGEKDEIEQCLIRARMTRSHETDEFGGVRWSADITPCTYNCAQGSRERLFLNWQISMFRSSERWARCGWSQIVLDLWKRGAIVRIRYRVGQIVGGKWGLSAWTEKCWKRRKWKKIVKLGGEGGIGGGWIGRSRLDRLCK